MEPGVALVICPVFASGTPPLSLASLQPGLRAAGLRTVPFDLDFMLLREDPGNHAAFFSIYNIGHPEGVDRVQFVIRPRLTLMALHPDAFDPEEAAADLAIVASMDARLRWWAARVLEQGVRAVLCSVYVSNLLPSLLLARAIRALDPSVRVAFGGPGVGVAPVQEFVLRLGIDACAPGEGESVAPPLARALLEGTPLTDIPGVVSWDGGLVSGPPVGLMALDALPTPDFSGFPIPGHDVRAYRSNPAVNLRWFGTALPIATTRGCVMRCTFCSEAAYWKRYRYREPEQVVAEIEALIARWGVRQFLFGDSLVNGRPKWLVRFAELLIERDVGAQFLFAYVRPAGLPRPTLELLARAGFRVLGFGMETASQALLDRLKKGTDVDEARRIYAECLELGIHVNISVLCGIPGETADDVMQSVRFVQDLVATVAARSPEHAQGLTVHAGSPLRVEPYSPMYADPDAAGIRLIPDAARLPASLADLEPVVSALEQRWAGTVPVDEIRARSQLIQSALGHEPATVFLNEALADWLDDDTVVRPARPARVLESAGGERYLADDARLLARVDPVVASLWAHLGAGASVGALRAALAEELGTEPPIRDAVAGLLQARLAWVDDFSARGASPATPGRTASGN